MISSRGPRPTAGGLAAALLLVLVLRSHSPSELARRAVSLSRFAPRELAVRRLGGSGAAFDRRYFSFLENARRRLPRGTLAVFLDGTPRDEAHIYLAAYQLAPVPVTFVGRDRPFGGSVVAVYGRPPGPTERPLAVLPEGFLWAPP